MKRQAFIEKLKAKHRMFGYKNLIYIDESGFDAHCYRDSAWIKKGHKILGFVSGKRKRRTNLIMGQRHNASGRKKEWLAPLLFEGSCTAMLVETWIKYHLMKSCMSQPLSSWIMRPSTTTNAFKRSLHPIITWSFHCRLTHLTLTLSKKLSVL